jgi:hypothetical protein
MRLDGVNALLSSLRGTRALFAYLEAAIHQLGI